MSSIGQRVLQDPIIRRVRRHTTMPTLFRGADSASTQLPAGHTTVRVPTSLSLPLVGVVRAELLPPSESLPAGHVIGLPPVSAEPNAAAGSPAERRTLSPSPVDPAPIRGPGIRPLPTAPSETEVEADDGVWRRLQTIFSKHEKKQAAEQTLVPTGRESAVPQTPSTAGTPPTSQVQRVRSQDPVKRAEAEAQSARRPVSEPPFPGPDPATESHPPVASAVKEPRGKRPVQEPGVGQPVAVPERPISGAAPDKDLGLEVSEAEVSEAEVSTRDRSELDASGSEPAVEAEKVTLRRPASPTAEPITVVAGATASLAPEIKAPDQIWPPSAAGVRAAREEPPLRARDRSTGQEFAPDEHDGTEQGIQPSRSTQQSLPLQAVWAVQRLEEPRTSPGAEAAAMPAATSRPEIKPKSLGSSGGEVLGEEVEPSTEDQLRRVLKGVTPGQPTVSSIEIIAPRRPRPEAPADRTGRRAEKLGQWAVKMRRPESLEAARPGALVSSEGVPPEPVRGQPPIGPTRVQSPPEGAAPGTSMVQLRRGGELDPAQEQPSDEGLGESELVQTEVGPLPADLWHLIGESSPKRPPPETAPSRSGPEAKDRESAVKQAVAAAEASPIPPARTSAAQPTTQGGASTVIQRRPDVASVETGGVSEAETEAAAPPGEQSAVEEPDVDELARRVYAEIKRRFSVEWERVRQRG
jgi:hypothetical protein